MVTSLKNKKILIFLRYLGPGIGGSERQAVLLARMLKEEAQADVEVWGLFNPGRVARLLDHYNVPWRIPAPGMGGNFLKKGIGLIRLVLAMRKFRPDIIIPFTDFPNKICGSIWEFTGAKSCIWNQRDEGREVTGKFLEKRALKRIPVFISNCEDGRKFLVEKFHLKYEDIKIIRNGVKLEKAQKSPGEWRKELGVDENTFIAVMVANLHEYKDHETLLKAWHLVKKKLKIEKKILLVLAGQFETTYEMLKTLATRLRLTDSVVFKGEVTDVSGLLQTADLGVYSSKFEGCPNGVLEPMAACLPVVATRITGTEEALGEDYPFLVPINNPDVFAEHILKFISDKNLGQKIGGRNYQRVSTIFKPERMFDAYTKLLEKMIGLD